MQCGLDLQFPTPVYPSMEGLDESSPLRKLYPETLYANGMIGRYLCLHNVDIAC